MYKVAWPRQREAIGKRENVDRDVAINERCILGRSVSLGEYVGEEGVVRQDFRCLLYAIDLHGHVGF